VKTPKIILVFGLPGSGKSFFASRLAIELKCAYVNSDQVRLRMFSERTYTEVEKEKVYAEMLSTAHKAHQEKNDLVIDATFYKQAFREPYLKIPNHFFIEITAADQIIKERLARPRVFSEADYSVYQKIRNEWEPFHEYHLVMESTQTNINEMLSKAKQYLGV